LLSEHVDPERSPGYQVRRCHRRFDRLLNLITSRSGLNSGYWYYLRVLWTEDGLTQKHLSDVTNVTESTTASMIEGMVRAGWVRRERNAADRREFRVFLTEEARMLQRQILPSVLEINETACRDISPGDVEICLSVLERMSHNLAVEFERAFEEGRG
jgi:DNA-binding MarR family transcriptional regulator